MPPVYKICPRALWSQAEVLGRFTGAPVDHADGYIHFSPLPRSPRRRPATSRAPPTSFW